MLDLVIVALLLVSPAQVHTANFSKSDSPNGLSRRGYSEDIQTYAHAKTDYCQQFWGGLYRIGNNNVPSWLCLDLGTGVGSATLPGPLINGGAFTGADFGPYTIPFAFAVDFVDWSAFANAAITTSSPPSSMTAYAGKKTLGVTFVIKNFFFSGKPQMNAGVWADGTGVFLDIYDNNFASLATTPPVAITGLNPGDPWTLRVVVNNANVTATISKPGVPVVHSLIAKKAYPGNPTLMLDVQNLHSAALRASGIDTGAQSIDVTKIEVSASNIPSFDGPATGSDGPLASTRPFVRRMKNTLVLDDTAEHDATAGGYLQGGGTNTIDLLNYFAGFDATPEYGEYVLEQLVQHTDQRVVRFACGDWFASSYVRNWLPDYPNSSLPLLKLYDKPSAPMRPPHDAFFTALDHLVNAATERGVYLIPVLCWDAGNPYYHVNNIFPIPPSPGAYQADVLSIYGAGPDQLGTQDDNARAYITDFVTSVVARYKDHPTILAWEVGNEWDNDLDPAATAQDGDYDLYWSQPEDCRQAVDFMCSLITLASQPVVDGKRHPVSAGYADSGLRLDDSGQQTVANFIAALPRFYPPSVDILSFHLYPNSLTGCPAGPSCDNATPCVGWLPRPFATFGCMMKTIAEQASSIFTEGRPLMIGETNWHAEAPYSASDWEAALREYSGESFPGGAPRAQLVLSWEWMIVPHYAFDSIWDMRPEDVLEENESLVANRVNKFEAFVSATSGAPRILASGWGRTFALANQPISAEVRVRVGDLQNDVSSVEVLNQAGTATVLNLTLDPSEDDLWTGTLSPATSGPTKHFRQIRATDDKGHVSYYAPRLTYGPPVFVGGPVPTGNDPVGQTPSQIPYVQLAGGWGFNPLSSEGNTLHFVARITDQSGAPLAGNSSPLPSVQGRWNTTGAFTLTQGWTNGLFNFFDDGVGGGDLVANDGIWSSEYRSTEASLVGVPFQEMLMEVRSRVLIGGAFKTSDLWPRLVVH